MAPYQLWVILFERWILVSSYVIFNNIPVILTEFTCELGPQTDYMEVPVGSKSSWVPVRSNITVAAQPLYSRRATTKFSLDKFIQGNYIYDKSGFI